MQITFIQSSGMVSRAWIKMFSLAINEFEYVLVVKHFEMDDGISKSYSMVIS